MAIVLGLKHPDDISFLRGLKEKTQKNKERGKKNKQQNTERE